jgi:3-hydroxybutyrate dehydrogenase
MAGLAGRVAVVTGGASGIGRAIVRSLAEGGASVVVADLDEDGAHRTTDGLAGAWVARTDVADPSACDALVTAVVAREGRLDILVNDAGLQHVAPLHEIAPERFEHLLRVMLLGPAMLMRAALPHMYAAGWGRIVNIGSINSVTAMPNKSAYVSAKHGLLGLTRSAALEAGPHGVTVNCVCPSYVRTPLVERQAADLARTEGVPVDEVEARVMLAGSAVRRLVEPEEVAACVRFLCSDEAAAITGSAQLIDGGWTAR